MEPRETRPQRSMGATRRDFAATLRDGRRVIGRRQDDGDWSIYVYPPGEGGRLLGYGTARTRPGALEDAGLSAAAAAEVLGRTGA